MVSCADPQRDTNHYQTNTSWRPMTTNGPQTGRALPTGVMLNAYPDSIGTSLADIVDMLKRPELEGAFSLLSRADQKQTTVAEEN